MDDRENVLTFTKVVEPETRLAGKGTGVFGAVSVRASAQVTIEMALTQTL